MAVGEQTIFLPKGFDATTKLTPENSAIAWDTHNTLFKREPVSVKGFIKSMYKHKEVRNAFVKSGCLIPVATKYVAAKAMNKCFGTDYPILQLVERIKTTLKERKSADAYLPWLFAYDQKLGKFAMEFGDCVNVDYDIAILAYNMGNSVYRVFEGVCLARLAYPQYLATNRGTQHILRTETKENTKDTFNLLFKDGLVLEFDEKIPSQYMPKATHGKICKFKTITSKHQKPSAKYFVKLQQLFNPNNDKHIVLIDSRAEYAQAASKAGLIGVVCKNEIQLNHDLRQLGVTMI